MAALRLFKKDGKEKVVKGSERKAGEMPAIAVQEKSKAAGNTGVDVQGASQLVRAHITEKATDLAGKNQYVFVVKPGASKLEVWKSVERAYGVTVEGVRVITVHAKQMRLGRIKGVKSGYKKAIVKVKDGQKIEILPT
jgi:large subunit ribosomal protein L23